MIKKSEKEYLRQQLVLLAERSKGATEDELKGLSVAMCETYKALKEPVIITILLPTLFIVLTNLAVSLKILVKNFLRS